MSRRAVSWEHLASLAYFDVVSLPSKPSSKRFSTRRWRPLIATPAIASQKRALARTALRVTCAPSMARPRQPRNHFHPGGDVQGSFLRFFENVVVRCSLLLDLRGHTVKALWAFFRAGEGHIRDGAGNAPVTVIERMDSDKPKMSHRGFHLHVFKGFTRFGVNPVSVLVPI